MLTVLKRIIDSFQTDKIKNDFQLKFNEEQRIIENTDNNVVEGVAHELYNKNILPTKLINEEIKQTNCFKKNGIVTTLKSNHGVLDSNILFDIKAALSLIAELKVGDRVEYLAIQDPITEHIKVVKILDVVDVLWDSGITTEDDCENAIEELRNENPVYFSIQQRTILGLITERKQNSIIVDTDYKTLDICLDKIEIDFIPKAADRIYIECNVQLDDQFVDKQGEILETKIIRPARLIKQQKCIVKKVNDEWGRLDEDIYFTFDSMLNSPRSLQCGDVVSADLIECETGPYVWRAIKIVIIEETLTQTSTTDITKEENDVKLLTEKYAVAVSADIHCKFRNLNERKKVEMTVKNNLARSIQFLGLKFYGRKNLQIISIQPKSTDEIELEAKQELKIQFEIESKFYGEIRNTFMVKVGSFRIKRSIKISVYETEEEELAAANEQETNLTNNTTSTTQTIATRNFKNHNYAKKYANQVWSKKSEVIPGISTATKRRFIATRIPNFEVPERLRAAYLTAETHAQQRNNIENLFSILSENELNIKNYNQRMHTLIHLEEIEYFINFRKYDRERAHFERSNEFLTLHIENLAEKRPSIVIGDVVRAINPWTINDDDDDDNQETQRCYDGVIHKVLFDRILLKFNSGFQDKYNGEDYKLEFYFSRFNFRKQHFAINRIVKQLGIQYIFPTKSIQRDKPQIDVNLNEDNNLIIANTECCWHNKNLNAIQKRAIYNIMRGEIINMPYIIFGPPGTGKTITVIETILQLVKNLPSARLLVGAPSNTSADIITARLIESGALKPGDFVRLVSYNQVERDLIPENLKQYCATVDIGRDGTCANTMIVTESGLKLRCQMKYLGQHRVTISTCSTLGNFFQLEFVTNHFTHVIIDEAGQCTEPEIMIPISQVSPKNGQVILAGDPNQLQAVVINAYAASKGLALSYLERTLQFSPYFKDILRFPNTSGYDARLVTKLLYNYRALPSIVGVYNKLFYDSELIAMITDSNCREAKILKNSSIIQTTFKSKQRSPMHGCFFIGIAGKNIQSDDSPSWYNPLEAKKVFFTTVQLYRENIKPENIGIITPYTKQVKHLRNAFNESNIVMPKIGSVEEFQGLERDIILISTVRSQENQIANDLKHSLGFVKSAKRMNVAISRPRSLLIIFGNPHLLYLDLNWRTYIRYCVDNDAYIGCKLPHELTISEDIIDSDDDTNSEDSAEEN